MGKENDDGGLMCASGEMKVPVMLYLVFLSCFFVETLSCRPTGDILDFSGKRRKYCKKKKKNC